MDKIIPVIENYCTSDEEILLHTAHYYCDVKEDGELVLKQSFPKKPWWKFW